MCACMHACSPSTCVLLDAGPVGAAAQGSKKARLLPMANTGTTKVKIKVKGSKKTVEEDAAVAGAGDDHLEPDTDADAGADAAQTPLLGDAGAAV